MWSDGRPMSEITPEIAGELDELRREVASLRSRIAEIELGAIEGGEPQTSLLLSGLLELPLLFYRVDADGRFVHVIGRAIDRIGVDPAALIGREVVEIFPEAETEVLEALAGNTVSSETSGEYQGRPWAALSFVTPVEDGGGSVGVSLDITDWKTARRELAASERRYRSLAETVPVAISRNDIGGGVVYANEPMSRLVGLAMADILGRNSLEFLHPEDLERVRDEWLAAQAAGNVYTGVFRVRRPDGQFTWVLSRSVAERDDAGEVTGSVSSLVDITERKQVEDELNLRVAERTAQLLQANKELEAFCHSVSHDLRLPLHRIDGFCRLLVEDLGTDISPNARDHLDRVIVATAKMDRLIDDFLTLSRASIGAVSRSAVDLSEIARQVADELSHCAPGRRVRFDITPGLIAKGEPTLLRGVIENLIGNAFKFTSRTAGARIEFFDTTVGSGERAFVVRDNGVGFDMHESAKLFTAFHRLHDENEFEGTGVGLATVDRIIRRHGGRIWAKAAPGRGASFVFTLPAI